VQRACHAHSVRTLRVGRGWRGNLGNDRYR
jgi:hypothetical protein